MRFRFLTATTIFLSGATSALAQSGGPYVGIYTADHIGMASDQSESFKMEGLLFGGNVGYDVRLGSGFIIGARASYTIGKSYLEVNNVDDFYYTSNYLDVGVRAGRAINDKMTPYLAFGYSRASIDISDQYINELNQDIFDAPLTGYHAGIGLSYKLRENIALDTLINYRNMAGEYDAQDVNVKETAITVGMRYAF